MQIAFYLVFVFICRCPLWCVHAASSMIFIVLSLSLSYSELVKNIFGNFREQQLMHGSNSNRCQSPKLSEQLRLIKVQRVQRQAHQAHKTRRKVFSNCCCCALRWWQRHSLIPVRCHSVVVVAVQSLLKRCQQSANFYTYTQRGYCSLAIFDAPDALTTTLCLHDAHWDTYTHTYAHWDTHTCMHRELPCALAAWYLSNKLKTETKLSDNKQQQQ